MAVNVPECLHKIQTRSMLFGILSPCDAHDAKRTCGDDVACTCFRCCICGDDASAQAVCVGGCEAIDRRVCHAACCVYSGACNMRVVVPRRNKAKERIDAQ